MTYPGSPMYSIPAPDLTVTHAGLLNSPDLGIWLGYGLVLLLAGLCMPQVVKDGMAQLWEPVQYRINRLHVSLLCGWYLSLSFLSGRFLSHPVTLGIACSDDSDLTPLPRGGWKMGVSVFRPIKI